MVGGADLRPVNRRSGDTLHRTAFTTFTAESRTAANTSTSTDESRPRGDFIPAETLVQKGTAGEYGTTGGTLHQPVLGLLVVNMSWVARV